MLITKVRLSAITISGLMVLGLGAVVLARQAPGRRRPLFRPHRWPLTRDLLRRPAFCA